MGKNMENSKEQMGLFNEQDAAEQENLSTKSGALSYLGELQARLGASIVTPEASQINKLYSAVYENVRKDYEKVCEEATHLYERVVGKD
jgi:hypothetical protein